MQKRLLLFNGSYTFSKHHPDAGYGCNNKKATIKTVSIVKPETKTLVLKAKKSYQLKTKVTVNGKSVRK